MFIFSHESQFLFFLSTNLVPSSPPRSNSQTRVGQASDLVERLLKEAGCALHDGEVYKKEEDAVYTYLPFKPIRTFLMESLSNSSVADVVIPCMNQLLMFLSDADCGLIKSIDIDYNFIEVQPKGYCFDIKKKEFIKDPPDLKGSPRAFIYYNYDGKVPYPKYFVEGKYFIY